MQGLMVTVFPTSLWSEKTIPPEDPLSEIIMILSEINNINNNVYGFKLSYVLDNVETPTIIPH